MSFFFLLKSLEKPKKLKKFVKVFPYNRSFFCDISAIFFLYFLSDHGLFLSRQFKHKKIKHFQKDGCCVDNSINGVKPLHLQSMAAGIYLYCYKTLFERAKIPGAAILWVSNDLESK